MFEPYAWLKTIHILLIAIWLGTDIGTFVAFQRLRDASMSLETRRAMFRVSDFLDMGPRTALIGMLTLGISLTYLGGWGFLGKYGPGLARSAAVVGVVWILGIWHQFWATHPPEGQVRLESHIRFQRVFRRADLLLRLLVAGLLTGAAIWSLVGGSGPIVAEWLAVKVLIFAAIIGLGVGIRLILPRVAQIVDQIGVQGSTSELEAALDRPSRQLACLVFTIWACIVAITWITVAKP